MPETADPSLEALSESYTQKVRPLLDRYCYDCHAGNEPEAEIDLSIYRSLADIETQPKVWQRVDEMLDTLQMPPRKSDQPTEQERWAMRRWVRQWLIRQSAAHAGDPGRVMLRRLSNAEYTYTLRDLTGVPSINPAEEFPVDGAAGEGFTNTGDALAMSPAMVKKFLDAAKEVAQHAVFLPEGMQFSANTTRRDWTDEWLAKIRGVYARHTVVGDGSKMNLQGVQFETNEGGVVPWESYFSTLLQARQSLLDGASSIDEEAQSHGLNAKYLGLLWASLNADPARETSPLMDALRARWHAAGPNDARSFAETIGRWQEVLWKFNPVGQIGREGGPPSWMEPVNPLRASQSWKLNLTGAAGNSEEEITVYLAAGTAGDGSQADYVVWQNPRLEAAGQPPIPLCDLAGLPERLTSHRRERLALTARCLQAVTEIQAAAETSTLSPEMMAEAVERHGLPAELLERWLDYLELTPAPRVELEGHFTETIRGASNYDFIAGWGSDATPSIVANPSDQEVRIPGIAKPHGVVAHPSPTLFVAAGWQSPMTGVVQVEARLSDAHPECGNGIEWRVQHRTGRRAGYLDRGDFATGGSARMEPRNVAVRSGELISLIVGPRQGNHSCDLTAVQLVVREQDGEGRVWDLAADVSGDMLQGNPHRDRYGNESIWHFYRDEMQSLVGDDHDIASVPFGSILSRWQSESDLARRAVLAREVQALALGNRPAEHGSPDGLLFEHLRQLVAPDDYESLMEGLPADERFGRHPMGLPVAREDLVVKAPATLAFRIPWALAQDRALVVDGRLDSVSGKEGSVQLQVSVERPPMEDLRSDLPFIVGAGSDAEARVRGSFDAFRALFPAAFCYNTIVPVDEVVTMTLFYREDAPLVRLLLSQEEAIELDRLWDELLFLSREPWQKLVALEQIEAFATQDRPDLVEAFKPLRSVVEQAAEDFRHRMEKTEPVHVQALVEWAGRAWRRPLGEEEDRRLRALYRELRAEGLDHEASCRLLLARILTSPAFLYRLEQPGPGREDAPVTGLELASRLSYFLWASQPDEALRRAAESGALTNETVLVTQAKRMLKDARTRRLALEFACQWLHIRDFAENDDKNENLYPEFAGLRGPMHEEAARFFEDMFRRNGSVLDLLDADHTFLNETLARHYGIGDVAGDGWRRVENVRARGRGGVLAMGAVLASQSGASRTSPILRGNWVYETLLGEHLPKPPPDVPLLPDSVPEGLTARELIERHSSVEACARCHERIDPYGFALEQYDAIGRMRPEPADTKTTVLTGQTIVGLEGLRQYLGQERREDVIHQFCRKLLGYALGREVQLSDQLLLQEMRRRLQEGDYRFELAVESIVTSPQFRRIRGGERSMED